MGPVHRKTGSFDFSRESGQGRAGSLGTGSAGSRTTVMWPGQKHLKKKLVLRNGDKSELAFTFGITLLKALHLLEGKAIHRKHAVCPGPW